MTQKASYLVLVKESHKTFYVSDLGDKEYSLGIRLNMSLAHAKAVVPTLVHHFHDDNYFKDTFTSLAHKALRFSPHVAIDSNYGLLINITGCAHLFGGEEALFTAFEKYFHQHGFYIKKAIAQNPLLAKALAYFSSETITSKNSKNYLSSLPLDALFIEKEHSDILYDLGIETIGALLKIPSKTLVQRFGIKLIQQLDQLKGTIKTPVNYITEKQKFIIKENLASPIRNHEYFLKIASDLITKTIDNLNYNHLIPQTIKIEIKDIFKNSSEIFLVSSDAHNDLSHWHHLLSLKIENSLFHEGIEEIKVEAIHFEKTKAIQYDFSKKNTSSSSLAFITDALRSRLGEKALFHLKTNERQMPEHGMYRDFSLKKELIVKNSPLPSRPLRLFKKPLPIKVIALLPDNPPAKIAWNHQVFTVLHANGPERIEDSWWTENYESFRDYFYIEDTKGQRLWIYSTGHPKKWFIHGIFA